jgi:hypothetical protein
VENFYFRNDHIISIMEKFPGKISVGALSPLLDKVKTLYIRGDTGGGRGYPTGIGGSRGVYYPTTPTHS